MLFSSLIMIEEYPSGAITRVNFTLAASLAEKLNNLRDFSSTDRLVHFGNFSGKTDKSVVVQEPR